MIPLKGRLRTRGPAARVVRRTCLVLFVIVGPLGVAAHASAAATDCSISSQNAFVRDVLSDVYLWRDYVPALDVSRFDSPDAVLDAARYRTYDTSFSYITSQAASDALFSRSQYLGVGLSSAWRGDQLFISQVFPGGPADDAGLKRGDRIVEIGSRAIADLVRDGATRDIFGEAEADVAIDLVLDRRGLRLEARLTKRAVVIPPVSNSRVLGLDGRRVGYLFFRTFTAPAIDALNSAFTELKKQDVTELILDLRYNSGGLVSVAQHLGSLIGGTLTNGQVFAAYTHNDRHVPRNRVLRFQARDNALRLNRVVVIATRASASASEVLINALRPFMTVVIVGERTYGKPVGQYLLPFCGRVIAPVAFAVRNADGEGDFFAGLPVTCPAEDDLGHNLGEVSEASLHEALTHLRTGACSPSSTSTLMRRRSVPVPLAAGWPALLGAH